MNINYLRSRNRETLIKHLLEKDGWYAVRSAGSKGIVDVIAIKPMDCGHCLCADTYKVKLVQVKVSKNLKRGSITPKLIELPSFDANIEYWKYPVRARKG